MKTLARFSRFALPLLAATLLPSLAAAQANLKFEPVASTPYDAQMARILPVLRTQATIRGDDIPTLDQVNRWMRQLHSVRYEYTSLWKTPTEVQSSSSGDCKAKAITLYYLMRAHGAKNIHLMIGRKTSTSSTTHAWLVWKSGDRFFLLDPTDQAQAVEIRTFSQDRYVPHFAFSSAGKFRPVAG